ncbi:MAG: amino acid ABC transporter permease [Patescibacteria group bacterium]
MNYTWNFNVIAEYKTAILNGTMLTLELTFFSLIFGTILGFLLALAKISKNKLLKYSAIIFIEIFTGLPLLVLLVWLYYALPIFTGFRISALPTAVIGLSLNLAGFAAEIFRAGIQSVPKGQTEASLTLGLTKFQIIRRIVVPQATKLIIPPLSGRYVETIKLTSLSSVISVDELLHSGQNLISVSFRPLEIYTVIAGIYLIIIIPLTLVLKKLEKKY